MRSSRIKTVIQYLIFLGLGIFLVWYSLHNLSQEELRQLKNSFREVRYIYILPVLGIILLSHYSRAIRWKILMEPLGFKPSMANSFAAVLIGYLFNLLVPRLGEVMKCTVLARYEKVAPDKLIGTIVAERAFDLITLLLVVVIMLATQWSVVGQIFIADIAGAFQGKSGGVDWLKLGILLVAFVVLLVALRWFVRKYKRNALVFRILKAIRNIWMGLMSIKNLRQPGWFLFHSLLIWICYLGGIWVGFFAFEPVGNMGIGAAISVLVFGSFGMIITQGGIGAYQIAVQRTLSLYGVSMVAGLSFGWILWGVQTLIIILFGALSFMALPLINRKRKNVQKL